MHTESDTIHVLIIEDDPFLAGELRGMLAVGATPRIQVSITRRIADAQAATTSRPCDVILLDLSVADANGVAGLTRLHAAVPSLPIVVLSTTVAEGAAATGARQGAYYQVLKSTVSRQQLARMFLLAIKRQRTADRQLQPL
jgi:DNA-binding NarL/FixJ family response regulator